MGLKKILLVEDDELFRNTICEVLSKKYSVFQAPNGHIACQLMTNENYDLVLSDIQMPTMSGIDLLEWSTKNKPAPFIMMTGFSSLVETKSAYDLGAKSFIAKPFKINQLLELIEPLIGTEGSTAPEKKGADDYYKVGLEEFISKPTIDFDIYIKLSEKNFIKIANKNEVLPKDQIKKYQDRGIKHFYIEKDDFSKLVQFNYGLVKLINTSADFSNGRKSAIMNSGKLNLEKSFSEGVDAEAFKEATSFLEMTMQCVSESQESFDLLNQLNTFSEEVYANSVSISFCAVLIAKTLGITSHQTLFKISMAGLFHDIGKKEIDLALLKKPRHLTNKTEQTIIESHVVKGQEILVGIKNLHSDVVRMALEHHEDQAGQGYPNAKIARDQHPLSKILQMAVLFVESVDALRDSGEPVVTTEVIKNLSQLYDKRVDTLCLIALKKVYGVRG